MKKVKLTPPPCGFDEKFVPETDNFLLLLRTKILNMTIDEFVTSMGWTNEKYYQQIVNGYSYNGEIRKKKPTINYIFTALNYAIENNEKFRKNKDEIKKLINKYIIKF